MNLKHRLKLRLYGSGAIALCLVLALPSVSLAQSEDSNDDVEEVVVTGSRLKRDTFSSVAPLQVITGEVSREAGLIDVSTILQESTASTGQQIDTTFTGFVLDNGPGASTISLRGLGSDRTLVLLNGRRLSPSGVEGAPTSADLNLIPGALVDRYDILLDGASSVYGSDAVAGVTNVILRKDFEGFEVENFTSVPEQSNGMRNTFTASWGSNFDRGFIGAGVEHSTQDSVDLSDRRWTAECQRHVEVTETGEIRTLDLFDAVGLGMEPSNCTRGGLAGRMSIPRFGSVYYQPGAGNSGVPDFSESSLFGIGLDINADGATDVQFRDFSTNGREQERKLRGELDTVSFMTYGEYTFDGDMNITPFFEASYAKRDFNTDFGAAQLFPDVPANNPFNPCNPNGVNGVDCGLAWDSLMQNPVFAQQVRDSRADGMSPEELGQVRGALGAVEVRPIVVVDGDRDKTDAEVYQTRFVTGIRGDLPQVNWGSLQDWSFEISGSYSKSSGTSSRVGIRDDRLMLSLSTTIEDPNNPGQFICGADANGDGIPDGTDGCVPINMFAPSLYNGVIGAFATQAERDYVFDSRDFDTEYEQIIITAFASGEVFEMPAGTAYAAVGLEYRNDDIKSIPDAIARDGLFFGFFSDGGANGDKDTEEFFGEIELPLLANKPLATELSLNVSARYTKDEFYGGEWTYAGKVGYRPVDWLLVRGTYGTSYRAPNLRENFLLSQTGFLNLFDPCAIPEAALDISNNYVPGMDMREPEVLVNCRANGVDPTTLNNNGFNTYSVEVGAGGATDLEEETSESISFGFALDQPWFDAFDLSFGATYYDIDIDNTIIEPGGQFIINDCYNSLTGNSAFCSRIARDADGFIDFLDRGFINRDNETVRGVDVNLNFRQSVTLFDEPVSLSADFVFNRPIEVSQTFLDDAGNVDFDQDQGEFGFPNWRGQMALRARWGNYRVNLQTRYLGSVEQDEDFIDDFGNAVDGNANTCLGPEFGDVNCRDVGFASNYFVHSLSVYYSGNQWTIGGGIRNLLNQAPPRVDGTEVQSVNNVPLGVGYDLQGRTYFINVALNFGT